jgi:hypothetical protein
MVDEQPAQQQQSASEQPPATTQSASEQPPPARGPDWIEPETVRGSEPPPAIKFSGREARTNGGSEDGGDSPG